MNTGVRGKWTRDQIRILINEIATRLEEWDAIIGDAPKGSDLANAKALWRETATVLSRLSWNLIPWNGGGRA